MKYKDWIIPKLKDLSFQRHSLQSIPRQIKTLEIEYGSIRSAQTDATPVTGGTNTREERLISNIEERRELEENLRINTERVKELETALDKLPETEQLVLDRFYINRGKDNPVIQLSHELGYEQAHIYRIKDQALIHLAKLLCGIAEV